MNAPDPHSVVRATEQILFLCWWHLRAYPKTWIAARVEAFGVNAVRLHHMDSAPWPRGILDPANPMKLHPEALARLDAFVDRLAKHGILTFRVRAGAARPWRRSTGRVKLKGSLEQEGR